jgi:hypothetical protein
MALFRCSFLHGGVELTEERERHIAERHPDLLPEHRDRTAETLADPDQVRRSARATNATLLARWFGELRGGKYVVVVVVSDPGPRGRHWIVTAYMAGQLAEGDVEWTRS